MSTSAWYKTIFTLDMKNQSWVEDTQRQVDFLIEALSLKGSERILDLACGYGRHALALARKGFSVVGVDIAPALIEDARDAARSEGLPAQFHCLDVREVRYQGEFDVVLNMADGAIGYLEDDAENLKIFAVIAAALRSGGQSFLDVCSADHARAHFPKRHWQAGAREVALADFAWDEESRSMTYRGWSLPYGEALVRPAEDNPGPPTRLYGLKEIKAIWEGLGLHVLDAYCDFRGNPATERELQLLVRAVKK